MEQTLPQVGEFGRRLTSMVRGNDSLLCVGLDPDLMRFNGKTIIGAEAGKNFGITDVGGKFPPSVRQSTGAEPAAYFPHKVK